MQLSHLSCTVVLALAANTAVAASDADSTTQTNTSDVVVVTATTNETSLKDAPASISVITNEELNRLPATDITTALEYVPGVNISRSTGSEPKIVIRGIHQQESSNDNFTLILINGRRTSSSETVIRGAGFDLSSIPMSAIDHVEIVRGPMSSIYGSDALGGVVNIILKQPTDDTHIAGSLTYSSPEDRNASSVSPDADGELKKGNAFISGSIIPETLLYTAAIDVNNKEGWYPDNAGSNFSPQSKQNSNSFNSEFTWLATDLDKVLFNLGYSNDKRTELDSSDSAYDSYYESTKLTTGLGHIHDWQWGSSDFNYFYERSKVHENNSHPLVDEADMIQNNHTLDGKFTVSSLEKNLITSGFQLEYTQVENRRDYSGDRSVTQSAVFIQDEFSISDSLKATLSGRFTHNNQFGSDFSPRAYLVYSATESWTFKGGYGEGFKAPTIFQSSDDYSLVSCGGNCTLLGNPDLKAQTSKTYELSARYSATTGYLQTTIFFNKINDMIDRDLDPYFNSGASIVYYENIDKVESKGVEIEGQYDITNDLYFSSNATYTRSINKENNSDINYTPRWLANANLNWIATDNLSLFSGINFTGKQKDGSDNPLSPYSIVALGGKYQVSDSVALKAGVTNLFDKRLDDTDQDYEDTEIGRTYYMTVDFDF